MDDLERIKAKRYEVARARRLAHRVVHDDVHRKMRALADAVEAEADALERLCKTPAVIDP